ncbi:MAG: phosphopantothenate/pantothenate synthetase [Candidatus Altiarchaeota archaeon]
MRLLESHPRRASLEVRHRLVEGYRMGLVAEAGLIAHGRGEAFDYLLGERTLREAREAEEAAVAALLLAEKPVISVNGNVAALSSGEIVRLAETLDARVEVNLFYRTKKRERVIANALRDAGAGRVYGLAKRHKIPGLGSERRNVDRALWEADTVLLALEDGDRTEALKRMGKRVIAVDLNPLSRTAQKADITIVDNLVRAYPNMIMLSKRLKNKSPAYLDNILKKFDNRDNLKSVEKRIRAAIL